MIRYHDALQSCLEAIAAGRDLDATIDSQPRRHRDRLRNDARLAGAIRAHAASIPAPSRAAEVNALSRLNAELNAERARREASPRGATIFGIPRFALAGLLLAAFLAGASFILFPGSGGNGTVQAAEFEGVVLASGEGTLTVQTLDSLEEIAVPINATVLDENGVALQLAALEPGEVVFVRGDRPHDGPVRAVDIRRRLNGLDGWCEENPERCRQIAQNLERARDRCLNDPAACQPLHDRVTDLITRVTDIADLEDLKQRCLQNRDVCRDITSFCQQHPVLCSRDIPPEVIDRVDDARARLEQLQALCRERDTRACRQIAQICEEFPPVCADVVPQGPLTDSPRPDARDAAPASPTPPATDSPASDSPVTDGQRQPVTDATAPAHNDSSPVADRPSR